MHGKVLACDLYERRVRLWEDDVAKDLLTESGRQELDSELISLDCTNIVMTLLLNSNFSILTLQWWLSHWGLLCFLTFALFDLLRARDGLTARGCCERP